MPAAPTPTTITKTATLQHRSKIKIRTQSQTQTQSHNKISTPRERRKHRCTATGKALRVANFCCDLYTDFRNGRIGLPTYLKARAAIGLRDSPHLGRFGFKTTG